MTAFRLFPDFASRFLGDDDDIDIVLQKEELAAKKVSYAVDEDEDDDDDDELVEDFDPDSPEGEWIMAKQQHGAVSASMDKLMALTGLKAVKVYNKTCNSSTYSTFSFVILGRLV